MEVRMTRLADVAAETRESARQLQVVKALEFGIVGAIEGQGMTFRGFSMTYRPFDCFMVVKAKVDERYLVAYVATDSMTNCLIKAYQEALSEALPWSKDKYAPSSD